MPFRDFKIYLTTWMCDSLGLTWNLAPKHTSNIISCLLGIK